MKLVKFKNPSAEIRYFKIDASPVVMRPHAVIEVAEHRAPHYLAAGMIALTEVTAETEAEAEELNKPPITERQQILADAVSELRLRDDPKDFTRNHRPRINSIRDMVDLDDVTLEEALEADSIARDLLENGPTSSEPTDSPVDSSTG